MRATGKATRRTTPPARQSKPLYHPKGSVRPNQFGSLVVWWRTPERQPDGSVTWHTHGKTLARLKDSTKEQARKKADQFLSCLKIPMMEDLAIEQVRREVAAVMARQRRDRGRSAVTVEKPEPQKLKSLTFD